MWAIFKKGGRSASQDGARWAQKKGFATNCLLSGFVQNNSSFLWRRFIVERLCRTNRVPTILRSDQKSHQNLTNLTLLYQTPLKWKTKVRNFFFWNYWKNSKPLSQKLGKDQSLASLAAVAALRCHYLLCSSAQYDW